MNYPNFREKQLNPSMTEPTDFMKYLQSIGRYTTRTAPLGAIICYDWKLLQYIRQNHPNESELASLAELYFLSETEGKIAVVGGFGVGAPAATLALENLIAYGVKKFISIGTAGTLQKDLSIGDLVVCDKAIRDEGVSHHYLATEQYAYGSERLTKKLTNTLADLKHSYQVGSSWTIDAVFRETIAEAQRYQSEGILTVEMEAAALFSVAKYRGVDLATLLTVSDSLAELKWNPQFHHERTHRGLETIYQVALKCLLEPL